MSKCINIVLNNSLTNLTGLDNLTFIGEYLNVTNNASLINLTGLANLNHIEEDLFVQKNGSLTSLVGLENLNYIGKDLRISQNDSLTSFTGLDSLNHIGQNLHIQGSISLTSLTALSNVNSIGGVLGITETALTSLAGLDNIDANTITDIGFGWNSNLTTCEVKSVCDYLVSPNGNVYINDNASGCNSQTEVESACGIVSINDRDYKENTFIWPNPATKVLNISTKKEVSIKELNIYSQFGQKILQEKQESNTFDVSSLRQGFYIIEVVLSDGIFREKLIIK